MVSEHPAWNCCQELVGIILVDEASSTNMFDKRISCMNEVFTVYCWNISVYCMAHTH